MNEQALVTDALNGDLDAFNRLVMAYQNIAFNLAFRMLGDPFQAEDATQDAFLSAYRHLKDYRGGSFKAWVMRMVTNSCYDELRKAKRRPTTPLEPVVDQEEIESPAWLADDQLSPEERAEQAELDHAIQHCLQTLSPDFRSVVILVDMNGMDYDEVASSTSSPLGTIKSRLARARLKMQDCLQGFGELLPSIFRQEMEDAG